MLNLSSGVLGKPTHMSLAMMMNGGVCLKWMPPYSLKGHIEDVTSYKVVTVDPETLEKQVLYKTKTGGLFRYLIPISVLLKLQPDTEFQVSAFRNQHEGPHETLVIKTLTWNKKHVTAIDYVTMDHRKERTMLYSVERVSNRQLCPGSGSSRSKAAEKEANAGCPFIAFFSLKLSYMCDPIVKYVVWKLRYSDC